MSNLTLDQEACEKAGKKLYTQCVNSGIDLRGYGVSKDKDGNPMIHLLAFSKEDAAKIPDQFGGYDVNIVVTGNIVAR